jgi:DNA polymerase III subunit delta'
MSFAKVFGHQKQIAILKSSLERDRVPHAYLFFGMPGIGKRTTAEIFARALNCERGIADACDECPSCRKMEHGNHPDVFFVRADGQFIRIKDIRNMQEQTRFRPFAGGRRIFILVDADKMNAEAANALLKTLEEPSHATTLILLSSRPHSLPLTILSRCQHLRFNPLPPETVASFLRSRLSVSEEDAMLLAASSGGSIRKALDMNQEGFLKPRDEIVDQVVKSHTNDPLKMLSFLGSMGKDKQDVLSRLEILKICYRDAMVFKETGEKRLLLNQDRLESIKDIAGRLSSHKMLDNIKIIDATYRAIEQNANRSLVLEALAFKLV